VESFEAEPNHYPYQAVVVDSEELSSTNNDDDYSSGYSGLSGVKSNVNPDQPLRQKPPSEGMFRVTPGPSLGNGDTKFGVSNPHYFAETLPPPTDAYGPTDFLVETVKLDKAFFHQFFTSKPLLLGTDVVTSTSVQIKRGREDDLSKEASVSAPEDGDVPADGAESSEEANLKQMAVHHQLKRLEQQEMERAETTTTTRPTTPASTTASPPKFLRYNIPPEVQVTHHSQGAK
jgi:hypothetical protein